MIYIINLFNELSLFKGKWQLCSSQQINWLQSKPSWNYGRDQWTLGFLTCQQKFWKETETGTFFSQLVCNHLAQLWNELQHYLPTTKDLPTGKSWTCDDLWINRRIHICCSRRESTALWLQMTMVLWENFKYLYILD